jgi:hypothetical protein
MPEIVDQDLLEMNLSKSFADELHEDDEDYIR